MNDVQKLAFIVAMSAQVTARVAMMQAQNNEDMVRLVPLTYRPCDFESVADELGLGHNDVLRYILEG